MIILSPFLISLKKNEERIKGARSSQTGFQPVFLLPQNNSPVNLVKQEILSDVDRIKM